MTELLPRSAESALPAFPRVVLFITRSGDPEPELLLQIVEGGLRLPDYTVAADETPEDAVARLMGRLALGSSQAELIEALNDALGAGRRMVLRPQFLRTAPQPDATLMRFMLDRGVEVQAYEAVGVYTRVIYQEYAVTDGDFALTVRRAGWITTSTLCARVEHFLFHVVAPNDPPPADDRVWLPLSRVVGLPVEQQPWLARVRARL